MVKVEGVSEVKAMFRQLEYELSAKEFVQILRGAGREIVKKSRELTPSFFHNGSNYEGELKQATKRDIGIVKSRVVRGKAEVNVGLKFKFYDINDQVQKVAPIVRHYTEGFTQTDRAGDGRKRGRVRTRTEDFIDRGFEMSQQNQINGINKEIDKKIKKVSS